MASDAQVHYSLKIEARQRKEARPSDAFDDLMDAASADTAACCEPLDEDNEDVAAACIKFSAGNPRVEHITGIVHLYRSISSSSSHLPAQDTPMPATPSSTTNGPPATSDLGPAPAATSTPPPTFSEAVSRTLLSPSTPPCDPSSPPPPMDTLCCLAIPADMSVAEFCTFCGAYLVHIREMRVLRREASQRTVCMVLIRLDSADHASSFFQDFNNKPFCSLEPDVLCRLVRVKTVELLEAPDPGRDRDKKNRSYTAPAAAAAAAAPAAAAAALTPPDRPGQKERKKHRHPSGQQQQQQQQQQASQQQLGPSSSSSRLSALTPPVGSIELPSCPVCLERLDEYISGIITTVCNHQFHSECLQQWGDTSCPVCRYCSQPGGTHSSSCSVCSTCNDLWICLICGHVGCGRYKEGHASDHWESSQHCYALELETQRVWDYAGDNYVHRLIQSKTDGKLVEVPYPAPPSSSSSHRQPHGSHQGGRSGQAGAGRSGSGGVEGQYSTYEHEDEGLKEAMIASKLDTIAQEYNHLITTQLDSQRQYFEGLLAAAAKEGDVRAAAADGETSRAGASAQVALAQAREAERKKQAVEKKLADAGTSLQRANEEKLFLRSLNETLLANQQDFKQQLQAARAELATKAETIQDLQEQVRDLMVYIEAQRLVASGEDLQGATMLPAPAAEPKRPHAGGGGGSASGSAAGRSSKTKQGGRK